MKNYTSTVNGKSYEVSVEERGGASAPVTAAAAAPVTPVAKPAAAAASTGEGRVKVVAPMSGKILGIKVSLNQAVKKGEVVGFSGLQGAGRTELAKSLFGKSYGSHISGREFIAGKEVFLNSSREAIVNGLAYVTEDRKTDGLILSETIAKNTTLARMEKIADKRGVVDVSKENMVAKDYVNAMKTKTPSVLQKVGNLSGGNQQKVLLSKWMFAGPEVLFLDEPTRGIDVGAKYEIYSIINDMVRQGKSVVMISSDLTELLGMCDRIYVMNEGKITGEFSAEEATQEKIMSTILKSDRAAVN